MSAQVSACAMTLTDEELLASLASKLAGRSGVRYAAVAAHAQLLGRASLAAQLLEHETCAAEQVPLLLELGEAHDKLVVLNSMLEFVFQR